AAEHECGGARRACGRLGMLSRGRAARSWAEHGLSGQFVGRRGCCEARPGGRQSSTRDTCRDFLREPALNSPQPGATWAEYQGRRAHFCQKGPHVLSLHFDEVAAKRIWRSTLPHQVRQPLGVLTWLHTDKHRGVREGVELPMRVSHSAEGLQTL